jgi:rhodanese-related sulfurtransferase
VQIDARELADLMRDKGLGLVLLDVRDEASYNRFHLIDARRLEFGAAHASTLSQRSVKVILGDDEATELIAYRRLAAENVENLYVLARGMPAWFDLFESRSSGVRLTALGANHPESRPPDLVKLAAVGYVAKVKRPGIGGKKSGGGCGG